MISLPKLKQRKLFQWALAYTAGAWTLFQMLALLANTFYWPDVVAQVATVILGVGFFAALLLAWYHGEKGAQRVSGMEIAMLTVLLVIAGVGIGSVRAPSEPAAPTSVPELASAFTSSDPVAEQGSIAVLPFVNMSSDPEQEFFSDGVTEELLNVLSKLPELKVAARTSSFAFKGQNPDVREIGRRLGVAHILEGSVRKSGDRVRITAQLIDAREGHHLWSESYDRKLTDIFAVQDEISRAIVQALKLRLSGGRDQGVLAKQETTDPEAHALVLQGRHLSLSRTREGMERGVALLRQAITRDPRYARAHAELSVARSMQAYNGYGSREPLVRQAREAGQRAVQLDPTLAEAHFALALIAELYDWDTEAAEAHYRRAIELNPGLAHAHSLLGWILIRTGRTEEAIASARRATDLDPVSAGMLNNLAAVYSFAGQEHRAAETYEAALLLQPGNATVLGNLAQVYSRQNRHDDAVSTVERARALAPDNEHILTTLAYVHGRAGRRLEALAAIRRLESLPEPSPTRLSAAYVGLGDTERVFSFLERAVEERDPGVLNLGVNPFYDPIRADPRMRRLLARMNLPVVRN